MKTSELLDRVYNDHLYPAGVSEPPRDTLNGSITDSATTMVTNQLQGFFPQGVVEFDDSTGELALTKEAETSANVDLLVRGFRNTEPAAHANGCVLLLGPSYPKISAFNALKTIISYLPSWGVYRRRTSTSLTLDLVQPIDAPAGTRRVIDVLFKDPLNYWPLRPGKDYIEYREFDPPKLQFVTNRGYQGAQLQVVYATDFTAPTTIAADEELDTLGLPTTLQPYLALGVAARLLMSREAPRVQLEEVKALNDTEKVAPGAMTAIGREMWKEFLSYVASERRRLRELQRTTQAYQGL